MTVTAKEMAEHYNKKVPIFAKRWVEIAPTKRAEFEKGVAEVLGVTPADIKRGDDWEAGIKRAKEYFLRRVKDKGTKLVENYRKAMLTD